jgi:glycosyltransferase involved in cell wall biosynthesis
MRILAIDTIAVEAARRSAFRALANIPGCEVHLLVPSAWKEQGGVTPAEPEHDSSLHLHVSGTVFGFRQHRVLFTGLTRLLRDLRPDYLYIDTEPENYAAVQCRLAIQRVSPHTRLALVSSRNLDYRTIGFPYKLALTHRWCDSVFRRHPADIVFVRPKTTMHMLAGYGRHVVYLPHPVDCTLFSPLVAPELMRGQNNFVVGYIGRLVESKGVELLVRAMARLPENVRAVIVGMGPARGSLERTARSLGVEGRCVFVPPVPYSGVPAILRSLNVLVLPSLATTRWIEQFGRVLIEAMACGIPVVASDIGEIPEVLSGAGELFPPGDEQGLVSILEGLSLDPGRCARFGATGRNRALESFSAPVVAGMIYSSFTSPP